MNSKDVFMKAFYNNELKDYFKGSKDYMLYPEDAYHHIDPRQPGTGNLMHYAIQGIIQASKEYPQLNIGNKVLLSLKEMSLSNDILDLNATMKAVWMILTNNWQTELNLNIQQFEELLLNLKKVINDKKSILQNTINFSGNISYFEEFNRMNESLENGKKIF